MAVHGDIPAGAGLSSSAALEVATLTLLKKSAKNLFEKTIISSYKKETGRDTSVHFASIADGAGMVK